MNLNQVARRLAIGMAVALPMALTVSTAHKRNLSSALARAAPQALITQWAA